MELIYFLAKWCLYGSFSVRITLPLFILLGFLFLIIYESTISAFEFSHILAIIKNRLYIFMCANLQNVGCGTFLNKVFSCAEFVSVWPVKLAFVAITFNRSKVFSPISNLKTIYHYGSHLKRWFFLIAKRGL